MMVEDQGPSSWIERTAKELCRLGDNVHANLTPELVIVALEAAGEMKAVRAKALLGKCWAWLVACEKNNGDPLELPKELLAAIEAELK